MPLATPADLRDHVALAIEVELSTIPLYLYALYSIEDPSSDAALLIRSVAAEEMLHVALATNLLLALGGEPRFTDPAIVPRYPSVMKHHRPELRLDLAPCSVEHVRDVFMVIERPEVHQAPPQPDEYETLGQFYHALELAIHAMAPTHDLFGNPQRVRQLADPSFYTPVEFDAEDSGGLMLIDDADSAAAAIEVIVHQGEGLSEERWADPSHQELTHYHKYKLIADGTVPLPHVSPAPTNPQTADYPPPIRPVSDLFNALYRTVFVTMDRLFSDEPDKADGILTLYRTMSDLMAPLARYLLREPIGQGLVAAPTFEVFELSADDPVGDLRAAARRAVEHHPSLTAVVDSLL
jgi:rubrerythrin